MGVIMYFVHILGAVSVGFYLLLPFVVAAISKLSVPAQEGSIAAVRTFNRIAQYGLIIQLLSGGYIMSQGEYGISWMILVVVIFLAMLAIAGIMGKSLRLGIAGIQEKKDISSEKGKLRTFSIILAVLLLVMLWIMVNPW